MVMKGGARQDVLDVDKCTLDDVVNLIVKGRAGVEAPNNGSQDIEGLVSVS
jgi:hypothetical protein